MSNKVTIKEIAKLAGVAPSTVSKIINNYNDVGMETKKKVLKIIEENNFFPSYSAKSLVNQVSNLIGVIYGGKINNDLNHAFFVEVINGFKQEVGKKGYDLLFFSNENFHKLNEDYLARCAYFNVDGCIVISGKDGEGGPFEQLDKSNIPCVGIEIEFKGRKSGYIVTDYNLALQKAVTHLFKLGHSKIAYIGGKKSSIVFKKRIDSFRYVMKRLNLPINEKWIQHKGGPVEESGYYSMTKLLELSDIPKAIFIASDHLTFGAIKAIKDKGYNIRDFSIVSLDDVEASRYTDPSLTTINQNKDEIGRLAAHMMQELIEGAENVPPVMVEPKLIVRESCGALSQKNKEN